MWSEEQCVEIPILKKAQYIHRGGLHVSLARLLSRTSPPAAGGSSLLFLLSLAPISCLPLVCCTSHSASGPRFPPADFLALHQAAEAAESQSRAPLCYSAADTPGGEKKTFGAQTPDSDKSREQLDSSLTLPMMPGCRLVSSRHHVCRELWKM